MLKDGINLLIDSIFQEIDNSQVMITMEICSGASSILLISNWTGGCVRAGENKKQTQIPIIGIVVTPINVIILHMAIANNDFTAGWSNPQ